MGGEELFGRVADADRVVDHQHLAAHMLEEMRRGDIGHVEGRILAHQDHVHGCEVEGLEGAEAEMIAALAPHLEPARPRIEPAVAQAQMLGQVVTERVSAALGLERQHEGGVGVDIDGLHRVHLDRDGEAHDARS